MLLIEAVMSHVGCRGEQTTTYKSVKTFPSRGKLERESSKKTISASGGSGPLHLRSHVSWGRERASGGSRPLHLRSHVS